MGSFPGDALADPLALGAALVASALCCSCPASDEVLGDGLAVSVAEGEADSEGESCAPCDCCGCSGVGAACALCSETCGVCTGALDTGAELVDTLGVAVLLGVASFRCVPL